MCHGIMRQIVKPRSQIMELGQQLGLNQEHLHTILHNTKQPMEHLSVTCGPPWYCGSYYGTISINDFNNRKKR
jgi:hypothetical protein